MSWSKSASGTAAEVKDTVSKWEEEVENSDRGFSASAAVIAAHKGQVARCADAAENFADNAPEGHTITVSANGHADTTTDYCNLTLGSKKPVP